MRLLFLPPVLSLLLVQESSSWTPSTLVFQKQQQRLISTSSAATSSRRRHRPSFPRSCLFATATDEGSPLLLYNSLTRSKEPFIPVKKSKDSNPPTITMYTCGPTVYDAAHIGNFRAFLTYDLLKRVLLYLGYTDIVHVCNITDVDDKILIRANEQNLDDVSTLTRHWETVFLNDLASLHCVPATVYPRATEHIPAMLRFIQDLHANGLAYVNEEDGSWYFDTQKDQQYGQQLVPQMKLEDMVEQKEGTDGKRHWADFCLWKAFKEGADRTDAAWESAMYTQDMKEVEGESTIEQPWPLPEPVIALGRPGWHLECSAMARTYFGDTTLDFHGGGIDLKFPHHENEIAQSQGWLPKDQKFCNCWFHNGFVNMGDEKMSKSLGNFLTLADVCPTALDIRAYRYLIISSQYRNALNFSKKALKDAKKLIQRLDTVMEKIERALQDDRDANDTSSSSMADSVVPKAIESFEIAIRDDLSMPRAAATLISVIKAAEQEFKRQDEDDDNTLDITGLRAAADAMQQIDQVFGLMYEVPHRKTATDAKNGTELSSVPEEVMELVGQRSQAKDAKDWDLADSLRQRITELGFSVKDVKDGDPIITPVDA